MFTHILLPTDGSELATAAVKRGIGFAKSVGARVTMIGVIEPLHVLTANPAALSESLAQIETAANRALHASIASAEAEAKTAGVETRALVIRDDDAAGAIVRAAESEGCDLIAMASHGRRGFRKLVLGSQTQRVVAMASVSVLVLR